MPVSSIQVSLSEVLQVRGGPLEEEELWSILCQSCKAIQEIFIQGRAIESDGPSFVVSPYTVLFSPSGTVQFAESIDVTLPNIANYLPPEGIGGQRSFSNATVEKMYVYALGKSLLWASDYMRVPYSSAVLSTSLQSLLMGMSDNNPVTRLALVQILEACTIHAQSLGYGMPYARHIIQLSKIVLGSIFALDQMGDSFNSNTNNSVSTVTGSPMSRNGSPEHRRSGRVSPGKRNHQHLNSSDSTDHKPKRTMQDHDEPDARRGSKSKHRRAGYSNLSSSTIDSQDSYSDMRSYKDSLPRSRSTRSSREILDERSSRRDTSHKSNSPEGRSYHMSDIFSPANRTEKSNGYQALSERSGHSRRATSKHSKSHSASSRGYESMPDRPPSRSKQRSPPPRGKSSRTNLVYERLRERRERLGRLRDQLGLRPRYGRELTRSVSDYESETDTMTEDESQYGDGRSEARSYKSLNSVESARQGSYHPDQYSQYSSVASFPFGQGLQGSTPQHQSRSVPNVHQQRTADQYDGVPSRDPTERRLQTAPSSNEHKRNTLPSRKKLKKFFGPEFVVMSGEPNESITMPISFLSKAGKIPPEKKRVTAVMLNGRRLDLLCDLGTSGQELFDLIASHVGLNERSYFGLAYIRDGEYLFIDPDTKLYKVGPESWREEAKKRSKKVGSKEKFTVFFRVKYYVENINLLRDQLTRHQYYLQLRRDILEERTKCDERSSLQLAALALQAEMGDHGDGTSRNYFLPEHYVAASMIESIGVANIRDRLPSMHEAQKGMSDVEAEFDFLMEARKLPEYGIHFHRVTHNKKESSRGVWLGVCTRGIIVYEKSGKARKQVHAHPWNKTKKIAFDRRKFVVEPFDRTGMKFVHFTESYKKGRYLVQLCKSQHRFHMAVRTKTNIAHQFQNDYGLEGDSYSLASGSLRYANHYEPKDEFDYSDGEQSMMGSVPSDLGVSSYTIDSMRHHGIPEAKRSNTGYEEVRIGRPPPRNKSLERQPHSTTTEDSRHPRSHQTNQPYRNQTTGSRSNINQQRVLRERPQPRDEFDGNEYVENGYEEVGRVPPRSKRRSRQESQEVLDDPPYATIESIKENRKKNKQNRRTPKIRGEENGYAEIGPIDSEKPYVLGTSIHNNTQAQSRKSLDQDESISESLRERLEDLPPSERPERDIIIVTLKKSPQKGLGLTIVGGENSRSLDLGIFVRSIEPHGPAHRDGRLHVGDRIISINGQSLEGVGHRVAVDIIKNSPEVVQLIVSQPKTGLNSKLSSAPSSEVVYANVHQPANTKPATLAPSQGSLENIEDLPHESSASENNSPKLRNPKQFPPTKPRRRPESFGSNYSLNSDQENGQGERKHGRYLSVEKSKIARRREDMDYEDGARDDDGGRITEKEEDASRKTPENIHSKQSDKDDPISADILDNHSADDWEDLDNDGDDDSKVTTPESSDMEDLFGDMDEKNKPNLNFSKISSGLESPVTATPSTVTAAMPPSSDKPTTVRAAGSQETEVKKKEVEQETLDEEVQEASEGLDLLPGDKYTVQLKKVNGSLGISVTGGVNTSVKHGGIYIKTMVPRGAADQDGRIKSGDRLLEVNGASLTQVTHRQAVEILRRAKDVSTLVIERGIPPAATSALPPTPVHFQQPLKQQEQQGEDAAAEGGKETGGGSGGGGQLDTSPSPNISPEKENPNLTSADEHHETDFATENEDLDLGTADEEYETGWDDDDDGDAAVSKSDPLSIEEPFVRTQSTVQQAMAPPGGGTLLPEIKVDPDIDDTEPPVSPSSDDVALSPTDIHRIGSPRFATQRKNSLGVIFHHDLENTMYSLRRTSSAASLGIHSEHTESDDANSLMMPSFASHATTPTIEALHDDDFRTPPLTDDDFGSENEMPDVPENEIDDPASRGSVTESPYQSDGYSDEVDDYLAEIASPTLSTREADTLTPTAHLTGMRKAEKRKSWISIASSHSPAPTESTQFGRTESSPRSSRRSQTSPLSESAESESEESESMAFSDNDIAGHWSDEEDHRLVKPKLPAESTPKDPNFVSRVAMKLPTSPEPISVNIDEAAPSLPTMSPPHSSRSSSPTASQASQISVPSPTAQEEEEEVMSPNSTLSSVGALTLTQTMLSQTMMSTGYMTEIDMPNLPYVTADNTFEVQLSKGSQGLGFSVMGGKGTNTDPRKCLIRVKKLFAGQAAAQSGLIEEGDVILAVNGELIHDATHPETVAKLRGAQQNVKLLLCRPSDEELLRLLQRRLEESPSKQKAAPPAPLDTPPAGNSSTLLSSPFSSPPLSPDPKVTPTATEPPPPPPPTSPPHSEDEDDGEDVTDQGPPSERLSPVSRPSPVSKLAAVDRSAFSEVSPSLPKLGAVDIKSKIPITTKRKSQDLGVKGKPLLSPSSSTESSPRKMQQIMSEPSIDFDESDVFEVHLVKPQRGGLGFTVAGGANTGGCYIKDILQEPAISDSRLRRGDKILEVNGRSMKGMSHFDAVSFLRMTSREVTLKIVHPSPKSAEATPSPTKPVKADFTASPALKEDAIVPEAAVDVEASPALAKAKDDGSDEDGATLPSASENDDDWSDVASVESMTPAANLNLREAFQVRSMLENARQTSADEGDGEESALPDAPRLEDLPTVRIKKNDKGQLGLLLGLEVTDQGSGLFVKDVVSGLPMAQDGSVQVGDQIHFINDQSVSGISMEKAKSLLARVPSLVELKATRNKTPVQPRRQRPISTTSTLEPSETGDDDDRIPPSADGDNDDEWMTDSSEPVKEIGVPLTLPATPKGEEPKVGGKKVSPAGFDLDLGDVSEEESDWEDLSVSDREEVSRLDEVGDIMKDLEQSHGGYTPRPSSDNERKSSARSITSPNDIPTSPTSITSPPLSPLSHSTVPSTVKALSSVTDAPSPSISNGASNQPDDDLNSFGSDEAFSPSTTPQTLSTPEQFSGSPRRLRHDSTEPEVEPELAHLPPLPSGKSPAYDPSSGSPRGIKSPLSNFRKQMSLNDARESPTGSEFSTSARIGTPTGRPPSAQGSEGGNLSIGEGGVVWIELEKPEGGGLGFSVVGAEKGGKTSIFIKTVTPDGVACRDGRLKVGDRLLQVNGQSLVGMTQNKVITILRKSKGVVRLAVTGQLSRPASLIGTDTERQTPSVVQDRLSRAIEEDENSDAELSPAESYTESARDAGFRKPHEQDTDSDIDSTADLPNDLESPEGAGKKSDSLLAAQRLGRALQKRSSKQESDDDSLSWGTDNSLPLDDDDIGERANGAMRGTPSTKILEDITDAQLESMPIVTTIEGGRYSGRSLRSSIAKIQKQIDKQDPAEEFKTLRQVKAIDNCEEAKKAQNKDKNRFRNVLPYDKTRVILEDSGPSDYINASHIKTQVGKDTYEYIACQGPLPNTTQDFWLMVWEQRADVIAMVTMDVESGKVKCHRYWPESANKPLMVYDRIEVRLENYQNLENFSIRRLLMIDTETSEVHHVTQMNFATWPDHSVPSTSLPLLRYACHMRRIHDDRLPIVVHCSAGIGRTGTLITIDVILGLIEHDEEFKVLNIVKGLRKQRQGMIQTKDQYTFCYKAALEALKSVTT